MSGRHLQTVIALVVAGLWGAAVYLAHAQGHLGFLDRAESAMIDLRTLVRGVTRPPDVVSIVAIDDAAVNQIGKYPLGRLDLARLVSAIARLQPKVIALDLLLIDSGNEDGDAALAKSLAERPAVIAAAAVFPAASQAVSADSAAGPLAGLPTADKFLLPLKRFSDQAQTGIVNVMPDRTGTPRAIPMLFRSNDAIEISLALRAATLATGEDIKIEPGRLMLGQRAIATDVDHALPITYYGPRGTIATVSAASLLAGTAAPAAIKDRIVVIGATVTGGGDLFSTPFDTLMPGAEVLATAITHLVAGDNILRNRSVLIADGVTSVLLPMGLVAFLAWRRNALGLLAAAAIVVIWAVAVFLAFDRGIWLSVAVPVAAAAPPAILFAGLQLWSGRRRAHDLAVRSDLLDQFQAPGIKQWLIRDPDFLTRPVSQNGAVVFIDLSGFTALSERLGADETRDLLKDFHALVDRAAVASGGIITTFMGDGAMILFGLPQPATDDAFRAAQCAVGLCASTDQWLASLPAAITSKLGFKVGAHFGTIIASRLGGGSHLHITATGDTVNVASRLMEVAADRGAALALSDELLQAAGDDSPVHRQGVLSGPHDARIRGRSGSLMVWLWQRR
jgi:adenylate cyclase